MFLEVCGYDTELMLGRILKEICLFICQCLIIIAKLLVFSRLFLMPGNHLLVVRYYVLTPAAAHTLTTSLV